MSGSPDLGLTSPLIADNSHWLDLTARAVRPLPRLPAMLFRERPEDRLAFRPMRLHRLVLQSHSGF